MPLFDHLHRRSVLEPFSSSNYESHLMSLIDIFLLLKSYLIPLLLHCNTFGIPSINYLYERAKAERRILRVECWGLNAKSRMLRDECRGPNSEGRIPRDECRGLNAKIQIPNSEHQPRTSLDIEDPKLPTQTPTPSSRRRTLNTEWSSTKCWGLRLEDQWQTSWDEGRGLINGQD